MRAEQSQVIHVAGAVTLAGAGTEAQPLLEALDGWIAVAAAAEEGDTSRPQVTITNHGSEPLAAVSDVRGHSFELPPGATAIPLAGSGGETLQLQIGPLPPGAHQAGERHAGGVLTLVLSAAAGADPGSLAFVGQAIGGAAR